MKPPGLLPSEEYFNKVYGEGKWGQGLLVSLGIGQGELGVSPVQMVAYTAAIAMNGLYTTPHLVRDIKNISTGKNETLTFPSRKIDLPQSYFDVVKKGMYLVVNGGGTAKNIKNDEFTIAGKTGTAQNTNANNHSWFVGFAPFNDPQIAVCVMGENQGWGNEFAAPIAASIIVRYLSKNSQDVYENIKSTESVRD
jgi:Cell division protein FtsI/penicillin-binding protein 2